MLRLPLSLLVLFALPVLGSLYYGSIQDPVWIITAFLSICVVAYSVPVTMQLAPQGRVRQGVGLLLVFVVGLYLWAQYLSFYLQGSYLNRQFFFHVSLTTLTETWRVYYPLMIMFTIWMLSLGLCVVYFRHRVHSKQTSLYYLAAVLTVAVGLDPGLRQSFANSVRTNNYSVIESFEDIDWASLGFDLSALEQTRVSAQAGKNLVLIFLEGVESHYLDEDVFPGLTPNLQQLNQEGWQLQNFIPVEAAMWTMGGIVSGLCGTSLENQTALGGNQVMFSTFLDKVICLTDVLDNAGYEQAYMGGATLNFAGKGNFFRSHSVGTVLGKEELEVNLADVNYQNSWGLFDDTLLGLAAEKFEQLAAQDKPFNLTLLTLDTHRPTDERSESCVNYSHIDNSMLHAVHCTDQLLGKFIARLKNHEAFEDTVVVITSDHLTMANSAWTEFPDRRDRRLFFSVLNSSVQAPDVVEARPMDLAPTILHLLGVEHDAAFLAGRNLFAESETERVYDPDHPYSRAVLAYLNSQYLSSQDSGVLYSPAENGIADIYFSESITDIEFDDGEISFESTGNDPYLILPPLELGNPDGSTLIINMTLEQDTTTALYFSPDASENFSEDNTLINLNFVGDNTMAFNLGPLNPDSRIRIDPGVHPGGYEITLLEIRE